MYVKKELPDKGCAKTIVQISDQERTIVLLSGKVEQEVDMTEDSVALIEKLLLDFLTYVIDQTGESGIVEPTFKSRRAQ